MNITWDAAGYAGRFGFVPQYGKGLLELITAPAGGRALDLGCGNGALTAELAARGLRTVGMDASREQLRVARRLHPELEFVEGDAVSFTLEEPVELVFSNAVFHWIDGELQGEMLRRIREALVPGGELVFEMGGSGNNARIHAALEAAFTRRGLRYRMPFYFPTVGEYGMLLQRAGLRLEYALLFDRPTPLEGERGLEDWMAMFVRAPFRGMPEQARAEICREAAEDLRGELFRDGVWYADYVRLRGRAARR